MTHAEKRKFTRELIAAVQADILNKIPAMPDDWDGHELRRYIADKFEECAVTVGRHGPYGRPYARRYRDYKNTVMVADL